MHFLRRYTLQTLLRSLFSNCTVPTDKRGLGFGIFDNAQIARPVVVFKSSIALNLHDPVRLLHPSFRDFLVDPKRKDQSGFWLNEVGTHNELASDCLRRLNESAALKSDICCVAQPGARRVKGSALHIAMHITPDVAYACSYWPLHLVKGGKQLLDNR